MANRSGDWTPTKDATEEIQQISLEVKPQVERLTGKTYVVSRAFKYRSQAVDEGKNFLIKVYAGEEDYLHLMVLKGVPNVAKEFGLQGVEQHRTKDSPLDPFIK